MSTTFGHKAGAFAGKAAGVAGAKIVSGAEALGTNGFDFCASFAAAAAKGFEGERAAARTRQQQRLAAAAAQANKLEMAKA